MLKQIIHAILLLLLVGGVSFFASAHNDASTLLEDVNKDGTVDIQDLVLVAAVFGQPSDRNAVQNPDVNRDGTVNVLDMVRVSNSFGKTEVNDNSTYHEIQDYIFDKSCASSACHAAPANAGNLKSYLWSLISRSRRTRATESRGCSGGYEVDRSGES